ncbi:hypothetical protein NPIL_33781 [Nephila pilipes]|uniref:Uncharacterized protein n=1 Tax=Nephila pilipes TaxID=299642 RepID=A0A8X6UXK2_NEPPI|nr:hypothetical protein NPIL_33781 [Nephila pilipes]
MQREDYQLVTNPSGEILCSHMQFLLDEVIALDSAYDYIIESYEIIKLSYHEALESEHLIPDNTTTLDKRATFRDMPLLFAKCKKLVRSMRFALSRSLIYADHFRELRFEFSHRTIHLNDVDFRIAENFSSSVWLLYEVMNALYITSSRLLGNILDVQKEIVANGHREI